MKKLSKNELMARQLTYSPDLENYINVRKTSQWLHHFAFVPSSRYWKRQACFQSCSAGGLLAVAFCFCLGLPLVDIGIIDIIYLNQRWQDGMQRVEGLTSSRCPPPFEPLCICAYSRCERWAKQAGQSAHSQARRQELQQQSPKLLHLHLYTSE